MKTTLSKVQEWIESQLDSYKDYPEFSDWDKGFRKALSKVQEIIENDGRYTKDKKEVKEK